MAPPRPQGEDEVSDGSSAEKDLSLCRSPRNRAKRNAAGGKSKQKNDAPPASRKQLNTEMNHDGRGKQKGAPKGGKQKTTDDGKGKQKGTSSGGKTKATDGGKEKQKKTDSIPAEEKNNGAKDVNKNKRDIEDDEEGDVEFVLARKIRVVPSGKSHRKKRKVVARKKKVEVLEDDDEDDESYYTPEIDNSDSNNSAHGKRGSEEAAVDETMDDEDSFDAEQESEGFGIDENDEEDNHVEASSTRTGHTAGAAVRPSGRNADVVATNPAAQSIAARARVIDLLLGGDEMPIRGMSKSESLRVQQKHVADRIRVFV